MLLLMYTAARNCERSTRTIAFWLSYLKSHCHFLCVISTIPIIYRCLSHAIPYLFSLRDISSDCTKTHWNTENTLNFSYWMGTSSDFEGGNLLANHDKCKGLKKVIHPLPGVIFFALGRKRESLISKDTMAKCTSTWVVSGEASNQTFL